MYAISPFHVHSTILFYTPWILIHVDAKNTKVTEHGRKLGTHVPMSCFTKVSISSWLLDQIWQSLHMLGREIVIVS